MAQTYKWRNKPDILARIIDGNEITTWRSQRVTLKPNEACMFIINGQLSPVFSDQNINQIGGGFPRFLASILKATAVDRRVVFGMTGPFDLAVPFSTQSQSGLKFQGHVRMRLQLMKEDLPKVLNYFVNHSPVLTRTSLARLLYEHVNQRLIASTFSACTDETSFRDEAFQSHFAMKAEMLLRPQLASLGLTLLGAYLVPQRTSLETVNLHRSNQTHALEQERINAEVTQHAISLRQSTALRQIECEVEVARAKIRGDQTLEAEAALTSLRRLEAVLRSEDERKIRLNLEKERSHSIRMKAAMEMFQLVQESKRSRESTN